MIHPHSPPTTETIQALLLFQQWVTDRQATLLLTLPSTKFFKLLQTIMLAQPKLSHI